MKRIEIILVFILIVVFANSQNSEIVNIKQQYYNVHQEITAQQNQDVPENNAKIIVNQTMPAIGPQTIEYNFYFQLKDLEDDVSFEHDLLFVTRTYNIAASYFFYEEFLYDLSGKLIFYYSSVHDTICKQLRCYFKDDVLIKVIYKQADFVDFECPENDDFNVVLESKDKLPEDYTLETIQGTGYDMKTIYNILDY